MASENTPALRTSLLDMLISDPSESSPAKPTAQAIRELIQAIRRDLQDLLNTRVRNLEWPAELAALDDSIINYGLPSFSYLENVHDLDALAAMIKTAIERFEPRLHAVSVQALSDGGTKSRVLRFKIQATLVVEPLDDRIAFTSTLEPVSGSFQVERASG